MANIINQSINAVSKTDPSTFSEILTKMGTSLGKSGTVFLNSTKEMETMFKSGTSGLSSAFKGLENMLDSVSKLLLSAATKLSGAFLEGMSVVNNMWKQSFGNVDQAMTAFKNQLLAPIANTAMGKVMSGFMDNLIQSMMFRFEEGLKWRETRQAGAIQMGTGAPGTDKFASGVTKWNWALGRDQTAAAGGAMAGQGFTDVAVFDKMLGMSKQMGMEMGEAAKELRSYAATGLEAKDATKVMETNFRRLQAAATGTTLPVKEMSSYVTQAATAARFMNVDIDSVGKAMAGLMKNSQQMAGFGLDMRIHGQEIIKDFSTGGDKMTESMYAWYGSKGGTEGTDNMSKAWFIGRFGQEAADALQETAGGGYTMGGANVKSDFLERSLRVKWSEMQKVAAGSSDKYEAIQKKFMLGVGTLGMSDKAAMFLAQANEEGISQMLNDSEMAAEFKSTHTIMGELQKGDARREQLQRLLVQLNIHQLDTALLLPSALEGLGSFIVNKGDKTGKMAAIANSGMDIFKQMISDTSDIGKLLRDTDRQTFDKMQQLGYDILKAFPASGDGKAGGGPIEAGKIYKVGENGEERFISNSDGYIIPNNQLGGFGGGVTVNLAVSGFSNETKELISRMIVEKMNNIG